MFYAHLGQYPNKSILYVYNIKTIGVDLYTFKTSDDLNRIIRETNATKVMFGLVTLPRKAVPVNHKRLQQYIRKFVKR